MDTKGNGSIFMTVKRDWEAIDFSKDEHKPATIPAGRHEMERIDNPKFPGVMLLVLKGTMIGASENPWLQWRNGTLANNPDSPNYGKPIDWGEFEVVVEEDGQILSPAE